MKRLMKTKKAQITVIMIFCSILLISSALIFYIKNQVVTGIAEEFVPGAEDVPLESRPIKIFVEDCLNNKLTSGLKQIGRHGGYIDPNDPEYSGGKMIVGIYPTESEALSFLSGAQKTLLPYWWYMSSANNCAGNCKFGSMMPGLYKSSGQYSIESQLDRYIEESMGTCLNDFVQFTQQGFTVTSMGNMTADTKVTRTNVVSSLNYPLKVSRGGKDTRIENFYTKTDLDLKRIYEFAAELTDFEIDAGFLELHAMNQIAMYSWPASESKIPPIADFTLDPGDRKIWVRADVQDKLESYVLPKMNLLSVKHSANFVQNVIIEEDKDGNARIDKVAQGIADKFRIVPNSSMNYSDIGVRFTYIDWWPVYLNINDQEVLAPTSMSTGILSMIGFNYYSFWYDLSFPVMVELKDNTAFRGEGYRFRFALEGNIRDNNRTTAEYSPLPPSDAKGRLACNPNQMNAGPVTITVKDMVTGDPVHGARIDYLLGEQSCYIGKTAPDENNKSVLTANFPVGAGLIKINAQGYELYQKRLFMKLDAKVEKKIELMPYMVINASVFAKALLFQGSASYALPTAAPASKLEKNERAIVIMKRINDDEYKGFTTHVTANNSQPVEVKLLPGDYEVTGMLMHDSKTQPIIVPKETITIEIPILADEDIEDIDFNESRYEQWKKGGVTFNNETGYLTLEDYNLYNSNRIVFYMLRFPEPQTHSEEMRSKPGLEQIGKLDQYSEIYRLELEPDWY